MKELLHFLHHDFPEEHLYAGVTAAPRPVLPPKAWLLGTSEKSAKLAAETGIPYAFGHFMSEKPGPEIMKSYRENFLPVKQPTPETIVAVSVICAETAELAEELALSGCLWRIQHSKGEGREGVPSLKEAKNYLYTEVEKKMIENMKKKMIIGNPAMVSRELENLQALYNADEIMIVTITPTYEDRKQSYKLIARECIRKN